MPLPVFFGFCNENERLKIECGKQHFAALDGLKYRETDSVSGLEIK